MAAAQTRNDGWKGDEELKQDLEEYVKQNLKRKEILDFVSTKYPMYAWSFRTLCRRLHYFDIKYIEYEIELDDLEESVHKEMNGPGNLLGYRALHKKIREVHGQNVPRNMVYGMMKFVDPSGLKERGGVGQPKRARKGVFSSKVSAS